MITKEWKQHKFHPWMNRYTKCKMWIYTHTHKYNKILFSFKEEILTHAVTWMNLGNIMPRKISHVQKTISLVCST